MTSSVTAPPRGMTTGLTLLFSIAAGLSVGNMYWAQPLLAPIASSLGVASDDAGLVITLTQIGYAIGIFFLVPLGDVVDRRRMIPIVMIAAAAALVFVGAAPTFPLVLTAVLLLGVTTISGQILTPLAGDLATDAQRGRVLGTVASGLMLGIVLARALGGLIAGLIGWRAVFLIAAAVMVVLAVALAFRLPSDGRRERTPYGRVLLEVLRTAASDRRVPVMMLLGALPMAVFTLFWTGLTLLLSGPQHGLSTGQIGLIGLLGIVGAFSAKVAGRLVDRGVGPAALGAGYAIALVGVAVSGVWQGSIAGVIAGVVVFSLGVQAGLVVTQTRMMGIRPEARSRMNTIYVVGNFIAGAIGSALASAIWALGGWTALMVVGAAILVAALVVWAFARRGALVA